MKLQLPHCWGGFGVTPNAGNAISAFYAASVSLVQWLGFCSHTEQNFIDLASTWAPGQDLANPDQWSAPILLALKQAHQVLLTDFGCHALFLASLRFCVHYCIDRDAMQEKKSALRAVF